MIADGIVIGPETADENTVDVVALAQRAKNKLGDGALLSDVATRAVDVASREDASIPALTRIVEEDPGLGMQIIRIANSSLYSPTRPIDALERAIMMLGLRECQSVILASGISRMMRSVPLEENWLRNVLCEHAVMSGVVCRRLNQYFNLKLAGAEFAAALLHDIGYIVIGAVHPEWLADIEPFQLDGTPDLVNRERADWGTDHAAVGAAFAEAVALPKSLVDVVRHHHQFSAASQPGLTAVVALGDAIAAHLQRKLPLEEFPFDSATSLAFLLEHFAVRREMAHPAQMSRCLEQVSDDSAQLTSTFF